MNGGWGKQPQKGGAGKQPQKEMQTVVTTDTLCSSSPGGIFKNREQTFSRTVYIKGRMLSFIIEKDKVDRLGRS